MATKSFESSRIVSELGLFDGSLHTIWRFCDYQKRQNLNVWLCGAVSEYRHNRTYNIRFIRRFDGVFLFFFILGQMWQVITQTLNQKMISRDLNLTILGITNTHTMDFWITLKSLNFAILQWFSWISGIYGNYLCGNIADSVWTLTIDFWKHTFCHVFGMGAIVGHFWWCYIFQWEKFACGKLP